jgi:hypothetical protein
MTMLRAQFTLRALLVAMLVVAAFFGGMAFQRQLYKPAERHKAGIVDDSGKRYIEIMVLQDGTRWTREIGPTLEE